MISKGANPSPAEADNLWPGPDYQQQLERLRAGVGQKIFIAELTQSPIQLGVRLTDTPYELLAVIDFPRPDPGRNLAPHLVILDDGRGLNLGRIARISTGSPFTPAAWQVLYQDKAVERALLSRERQLSTERIKQRARHALARTLGQPETPTFQPHGSQDKTRNSSNGQS